MNKLLNQNPLLWVALLSFALSIGLSFHDVINSDGILYLQVARQFVEHHYAQGLTLYGWPFYSALIALISTLTPLSLEHSAILINASLMALMGSGFVALARELGANKNVQWVAALIFLAHPAINGYREYFIRDFGGWAFLLWSIVCLCRFSNQPSWKGMIAWTVTVTLAVLFRPENMTWLLLGPLVLFFMKHRLFTVLQCYTVFMILGVLFSIGFLLFDLTMPANRIHELLATIQHLFSSGVAQYTAKAEAFSGIMSIYFKEHHALWVLGFSLLFYLGFLIIKVVSPLYVILLGYAAYHRPLITKQEIKIVFWVLLLYGLMYLVFIGKNYFISSRYLIPWVTVAMIWVPFALSDLWGRSPKALKATLALILIAMFLDGVISFGYSKQYIKDAGAWINVHTSANALIYTDNKQVAYYAERTTVSDPKTADIVAIYYSRKHADAEKTIESLSHQQQVDFHNKRKDGVRVIIMNPAVISNHPQELPQDGTSKETEPN